MKIVLNKASGNAKGSKHRLQKRFDKLQAQLAKQQKINQKFWGELDELAAFYQEQLLVLDGQMVQPLTLLVHKLIKFYGRKSLSQWHREELTVWINDTISRVERVDANVAAELRGHFRQVVAQRVGLTEDELEEEMRLLSEQFNEAVEAFSHSQQEDEADINRQADIFGFDDVFDQEQTSSHFFNEDAADDVGRGSERQSSEGETRIQRLMDGAWVRNLFRRTAQALHPDREPNPEHREAKVRSMQQLLEARKQGDVLTLLNLYSQCVDGDDIMLAEQEMSSACELMQQQLDTLRTEKLSNIYQSPLRAQVHDLLYSHSRKTRENNMKAFKQELECEADHTVDLLGELRNLKVLKMILECRREDRMIDNLDMMFEDIWQ